MTKNELKEKGNLINERGLKLLISNYEGKENTVMVNAVDLRNYIDLELASRFKKQVGNKSFPQWKPDLLKDKVKETGQGGGRELSENYLNMKGDLQDFLFEGITHIDCFREIVQTLAKKGDENIYFHPADLFGSISRGLGDRTAEKYNLWGTIPGEGEFAAEPTSIGFIPASSPYMEGVINLHQYICIYLFFITGFVGWLLFWLLLKYKDDDERQVNILPISIQTKLPRNSVLIYQKLLMGRLVRIGINGWGEIEKKNFLNWLKNFDRFTHWTEIELIWTTVPSIILMLIAIPSFLLLYSMEEYVEANYLVLKAIGHQWYWTYEMNLPGLSSVDSSSKVVNTYEIASYMLPLEVLKTGERRLLESDNPLILPSDVYIKLLITSVDVLHSWAVPALGVKIDACPGRLNQAYTIIGLPGSYYGQCSEICGVNHGFMPIHLEVLPFRWWTEWYSNIVQNQQISDNGKEKSIVSNYIYNRF
jgi:cytochrome c oxidase subunit 2